jgi:hypothetical protein
MKTTEIAGFDVTYYFKDVDGITVNGTLSQSDKEFIAHILEEDGKMKGKLPIQGDVTLFWNAEF